MFKTKKKKQGELSQILLSSLLAEWFVAKGSLYQNAKLFLNSLKTFMV